MKRKPAVTLQEEKSTEKVDEDEGFCFDGFGDDKHELIDTIAKTFLSESRKLKAIEKVKKRFPDIEVSGRLLAKKYFLSEELMVREKELKGEEDVMAAAFAVVRLNLAIKAVSVGALWGVKDRYGADLLNAEDREPIVQYGMKKASSIDEDAITERIKEIFRAGQMN